MGLTAGKPFCLRYFIAEGRLVQVYFVVPLTLGIWIPIAACRPSATMLQDWSFLLLFLFLLVIAPMFFFFVSLPYAWFVLWPIHYLFARWNGAPFHPGDRVRVLSHPYRDRLGQVCEVRTERNEVSVTLDDQPDNKEVFLYIQVCRDHPA